MSWHVSSWVYPYGTLCTYWTWLTISFSTLEKFSTIISSKIFSYPFVLSSSVQFSCSVVSKSLWPHGLQHARPPYPSPTPRVCSNSCPLSQWWHPTISSSVVPFSCPQSLPASGSFPMSQLFTWGGQSTGVSALACYSVKQQVTLRNMILLKMLASSYFQMIAHMGNPRESISYEN